MAKQEKKKSSKVVITLVLFVIWVVITQSFMDSSDELMSMTEWLIVTIVTYVMAVIWYQLMSRK